MNRIFITGDTHGDIDIFKLNSRNFPCKDLTKDDYVIILGDVALYWFGNKKDKYIQQYFTNKPWTTLWIDGNHENFNEIDKLPVEMWHGGLVQKTNNSIIHLMRGQVYDIAGRTFFTMGGARSHDMEYRTKNVSWWPQEMPDIKEMAIAMENLNKCNWKVDYVLTHCCSLETRNKFANYNDYDELTDWFNILDRFLDYKHWYFGHYHRDIEVDKKHTLLYKKVIELED